jgi:hypothetical protein
MVYCAKLGWVDPSKFLPKDFDTWLLLVVRTFVPFS